MKVGLLNSDYSDYMEPFLSKFLEFDFCYITVFSHKNIKSINTKYIKSSRYLGGFSFSLISFLFKSRFDVIISFAPTFFYTLVAHFIQKIRNKKHIIYNELWWESKNWKFKLFFPIVKFLLINADLVIVPGTLQEDFLKKIGVSENKIVKGVYASKDLSKISLNKDKFDLFSQTITTSNDKIRFLYFARVVPYKGLDLLIKAFARLEKDNKNIELVVTGNFSDDDYFKYCQDLANKLGILNIYFLGSNSIEWTPYFFNWCDIAVFPVIYKPNDIVCGESWGLVVNEAMSRGKFVIGTDAMASAVDMIEDGKTGFLVKNGDVKDLYLKMKRSLKVNVDSTYIRNKINEKYSYNKMFEAFDFAIKNLEK